MDIQSINNLLHSPENNVGRNGFDLSHRKVLTFKVGELLPVLCKEMVPKDYFEVDIASLVRSTMPLNTAAFMRCKMCYDFFFVPMTSVWRNFDKHYYQRDDNYTSYVRGSAYTPNVSLAALMDFAEANDGGMRDSKAARLKLLNLLGYGDWIGYDSSDFASEGVFYSLKDKSFTALPLYAYNRIYNMHYRDAWKDEPQAVDVDAMSADNVPCTSYAQSLITYSASPGSHQKLVQMHYHRYPQDLFMGLLPSQQFGSVSSIQTVGGINISSTTSSDADKWVIEGGAAATRQNVDFYKSDDASKSLVSENASSQAKHITHTHGFTVTASGLNLGSFDIITLRKAIAAQKWKEYNARAGWKSGKQAKAMFGVSIPDDRRHDVEYLDGVQFPIMVDEVIQTSQTSSNSQLGDLGGKVIGVGNSKTIKFSSGERFGYFFCIAYILPQVEYNAIGIDKQLVRSTAEDYYMPAYANLGLEPVFKWELNANDPDYPGTFGSTLGYAPRYHEYKTDTDKVYCEFITGTTLYSSLQSWVTVRRDLQNAVGSGSIPVSLLYVSPAIMDTLFAVNADGSLSTDQFMANINFRIKATRPMTELGLPVM